MHHSPEDRKHVLVVDNHEVTRNFLMRLIEALGYRVVVSSGGRDAIHMLGSHHTDPFDLIVVEINMHETDGVEVAEYVRHLNMETPIIFTSNGMSRYNTSVLKTFTPHVIMKPITDIPAMQELVRQVIERPVSNGTH